MRKFYLYSLLTALLLLCSTVASAHNFEVDGVFYSITSSTDKTVAVTYSGSNSGAVADEYTGAVVIPATVTYNNITYSVTTIGDWAFSQCTGLASVTIPNSVTSIGYCAFNDCTSLTSVTIPNSVTSIGIYAFRNCTGLTSITIPNSVTTIGNCAFEGCTGLTSITIPNSVTTIGDYAFNSCTGLASVTIPNSVTSIGYCAFYYCTGLTSITIPNSVTTIGDWAFSQCNGLTSITIGNSVTTIGDYAFQNCTGLESITIPNSVTTIGEGAFYKCSGLTSVAIPNSVTSIGGSAFYGCTGLTSITVNSGNSVYDSREGCNAIIETATNTLVTGCKNTIIPNSVTSIGDEAFRGCAGLTSITIPNSVTSIGYHAFDGCTGLTSIVVDAGNSVYDSREGCNAIIETATNTLIAGCKNTIIPNSVTTIEDWAFSTGLTSITIPNSVTSIGYRAFEGCTGLTSIVVDAGNSVYDSREGCNAIIETATNTLITGCKNTIIPNSVTTIRDWAFSQCTGLTSITIPNSVTSIGDYAFNSCTGLTSVTIPNSVTKIGDYAFNSCTGLKTVYNFSSLNIVKGSTDNGYVAYYADEVINAPNGSIEGDYVFGVIDGVNTLCGYIGNNSTITLPENYKSENYTIGADAFRDCTGLTSVTIGNNVTGIGSYAFRDCTGLKSVTIGNSVTSIGSYAFYDCTGLKSVTIGNSVTSIGSYAFYDCTGLTSITIPNSVTTIGNDAFYDCTGLKVVYNNSSLDIIARYTTHGYVAHYTTVVITENNRADYDFLGNYIFATTDSLPKLAAYIGNDSILSLPGNYKGENYVIGDIAFADYSDLKSVTIPNSVTTIGEGAFSNCSGLTSITIPNSVTSIGDYAFNGCTGIKNVRIEDGDTKLNLGKNGFIKGLFYYCPLESLYLGRNLNYSEHYDDGYSPFAQITTLTSVTIGDNVNSLNTLLFKDCSNLNAITIPESVQIIEDYVFQYCDLREIHIPAGVTTIGDYAFSHNNNLEKITAAKENTRYSTPEGYNVLIDNNTIYGSILVLGGKGAIIPDGIFSIGDGAFNGIHGITSITIPASVEAIGSYAFESCSDLKEIHCLATDRYISVSDFAFYGLYETTTLYIPAAGKKYYTGSWADFANIVVVGEIVVDGLSYAVISEEEKTVQVIDYSGSNEVVNIPSSITYNGEIYKVTAICYEAFKDYTNISGITIPASVSSIGYDAFVGCTNLASIKVESGNPVFDSRENCNAIITTAINKLIQGCKNTIIPNSVTTIGGSAFDGCTGLTGIEIPNSVTSIGGRAFYGCTGLKSVTIGNNVTSIGSDAFLNSAGLKTVYNFSSLKLIKGSTDNGYVTYYADKVINVPDGSLEGDYIFTVIDGVNTLYAYIGNDSIISLPANYKGGSYMIGDNAFNGNMVITGVTIPDGVTAIGADAFKGCTALKDIYAQGNIPALLDSEAFAEHYASATLHVPAGTKAAYQSSVSQREEMEIRRLPVYNNDLLASMSGFDDDAEYEMVKVEAQNPDVAGTLNGNDYLLAYQPLKTKMTDLPKATFETSIARNGRYKIALVTVPWFIESYSDTLISKATDPQYADSYLRVRVNQNKEQLAMFPCDSFNIGTSKTNFGVWEKHAIVPDRSRIDTIFLKDANNEDYIFDFVNNHSVDVNIELLRPLQYNEGNGRYTAKNANRFAFRFLLDQIMLIPVEGDAKLTTTHWKNFANIVEEANDLTGDVDGDGVIDVADATTLVSMILDNSLATDAADVDGDGTVDVADATALVSIILGKDTASAAPAKAAATRAGEVSTVSADGDGETLLINIDNPGYPFSAIQFDLELPEGIEVDFDGEYYAVDLGSRTNSRKHSYPECAIQPDGSLRVVIISMSNALYNGTEGDVATATLKVNGATDGDYRFTIKNVVLSAPGSKEKLEPYTGWINVTGGVTGISDIKEERAESNDIYDLQGRKVSNPVKGGIYIQNGKKVIW